MKHLIITCVLCLSAAACTETGQSTPQYYSLTPPEVSNLKKSAYSDNNGASALRLAQYYNMSKYDREKALYWYRVSAEANNGQGMYGYGVLLEEKGDADSRREAHYWFEKAQASGDENVNPLAADHLARLDSTKN